jgi:hypothetical protein
MLNQETGLHLGNVIDVLHEVQTAKRELLNLLSTNFNCKLSNTSLFSIFHLSFFCIASWVSCCSPSDRNNLVMANTKFIVKVLSN